MLPTNNIVPKKVVSTTAAGTVDVFPVENAAVTHNSPAMIVRQGGFDGDNYVTTMMMTIV